MSVDIQILISYLIAYFFWLSHKDCNINIPKSKTIFHLNIMHSPVCSLWYPPLTHRPDHSTGDDASLLPHSLPAHPIQPQSLHSTTKCPKPSQFTLSPCHFSSSGHHHFAFGLLQEPLISSFPFFKKISLEQPKLLFSRANLIRPLFCLKYFKGSMFLSGWSPSLSGFCLVSKLQFCF